MSDMAWRTISSRLGWFVAATFVVSMVVFALLQFNISAPEPEFAPDGTLVDNLLAGFENEQVRWIQDLVSSLVLAAGFAALAVLGATLRRALGDDTRGAVLAVTFLLAGAIGAASQILYVGATEVATDPNYCDCGFLAEEIISRGMAHNIAVNVVFWMTDTSVVLFAVGLLAFAAAATESGWVSGGLAMFSRIFAVVALLGVIWGRVAVPLLLEGQVDLDYQLIGTLLTLLVAGVLVPIWAAWLARSVRTTGAGFEAAAPTDD